MYVAFAELGNMIALIVNPVNNFLVIRRKTNFKNIVCIAHNAKAFDSQFIQSEIVENRILKKQVRYPV